MIFVGSVWMLAHALEAGSVSFGVMDFFNKVQFISFVILSTVWLVYIIKYLGYGKWLTIKNISLLSIMPVLTTISVFTNDYHNLVWTNVLINPDNHQVLFDTAKGLVGWFCIIYAFILFVLSSTILVLKIVRVPRFGQKHLGILIIAVGIFLLTALIDVFDIEYLLGIPISPAIWGFTVNTVIVVFTSPRRRLDDILPVARETIIDRINDGVIILDTRDRILDINPAALDLIGCTFSDAYGELVDELWHSWNDYIKPKIDIINDSTEVPLLHNNIQHFYDISVSQLLDSYDCVIGRSLVFRDITEKKIAEEALRQSEEQFRQFFEHGPEYCYIISPNLEIIDINNAALKALGYKKEQLIGKPVEVIYAAESLQKLKKCLTSLRKNGGSKDEEMTILTNEGNERSVLLSASAVKNKTGKLLYSIAMHRDITERKHMEEQLQYMATHDILTGLPNRVLLQDRLSVAIAQATRFRKLLAVMMLDLDKFKIINDKMGHAMGDKLLKLVGERLSNLQRKGDTIARIGGDEFLIVALEITDIPDSSKIGRKILDGFKKPFVIDTNEIYITPSIGIAIFPYDGLNIDTLFINADTAMYKAKECGGNKYLLYCPSLLKPLTPTST
jgi:diguanylate cyclase (GGDEF)-like protein/PAS domain S-box-containing protein